MSMLAEIDTVKQADSFFGGPSLQAPTLDDLMNRVGSDFAVNAIQRRREIDRIRAAMAQPGNSVSTPIGSLRGMIGNGLRAIADRYFTPQPLSQNNIPGYRRMGV